PQAVLAFMPEDRPPSGPRPTDLGKIEPDPMAYQDDMAFAAEMLGGDTDEKTLDYVAQFLTGVARSADDATLFDAARTFSNMRRRGEPSISQATHIAGLVNARISRTSVI
ncbi:MAG: response regulator, partial [Pseudomonadota bacterium]